MTKKLMYDVPTEGEVRNAYVEFESRRLGTYSSEYGEWFDTWLADEREDAWQAGYSNGVRA